MAHLITLTGAVDGQEMLFNLDTVVSIEKGPDLDNHCYPMGQHDGQGDSPRYKAHGKCAEKENERLTLPPKWSKVVLWF